MNKLMNLIDLNEDEDESYFDNDEMWFKIY